jgi:hypothetical protein
MGQCAGQEQIVSQTSYARHIANTMAASLDPVSEIQCSPFAAALFENVRSDVLQIQ